jgi:hypothetical protein
MITEEDKPYLGDDSLAKATQANADVWSKRFLNSAIENRSVLPSLMNEVLSMEVLLKQKEDIKKKLMASLKKIELEISTLMKEIELRKRVVCRILSFF